MLLKLFAVLFCVPVGAFGQACDDIDIDSVENHRFKQPAIVAVARSHGKKGIADYVVLVPPGPVGSPDTADIKRLIVMANVRPMVERRCATFVDPQGTSVNCAQSISGQDLKMVVTFDELATNSKERMPTLLSYVKDEVLCSS